jgi:hypothetical protein
MSDITGNRPAARAILFGRFMLPDSTEHPCQVDRLTPEGAVFLTGIDAPPGIGIVAYIDEIGRLEAVTGEAVEGGFAVEFQISESRRERVASRIRSLQDLAADDDDDEIRHRRDPRQGTGGASHITLPDGRVYPCEVIDVSISGAAVKAEVLPALGTGLLLGKMHGRVVRYLENGVAIEFANKLDTPLAHPPG